LQVVFLLALAWWQVRIKMKKKTQIIDGEFHSKVGKDWILVDYYKLLDWYLELVNRYDDLLLASEEMKQHMREVNT